MALFNLTELRARLAPGQRLIGLDPGSRVIGVALSDVSLLLASPYGSLRRGRLAANAGEISAIAEREGAGGLVVGLPLSMDGRAGAGGTGGSRLDARALAPRPGCPPRCGTSGFLPRR